ncbi:hypothetical protein BX666DRAFT_1989862 [Dichotomocladium elegans]|nr:hypothetical protein BX666DRAFT_1989862 [Dichotomocladium elegans]
MSSIYNTSHSPNKGRGRAIPGRPMNTPYGGTAPRPLLQQQQQQQHRRTPLPRKPQPPAPIPHNIPFNDFQLMSCKKRGKSHVMDFKTNRKVDFKTFARPVKLQRKDNNTGYNRMHQRTGAGAGAGASSHNGMSHAASGSNTKSSNTVEEIQPGQSQQQQQQQQQQHGPKTGADTSLIAPMGGATRNKQMLFKKRTKQIFLAKEDTRELKEQEHKPWILEDYDGQNSYTGTYEGSQKSDYVFFVVSGNDFKVVPVDRWYRFQQKRNFATFTLEEAEEQLKNHQKREQNRWMMLKRNRELAESQAMHDTEIKPKFKKTDHGEDLNRDSDDEGAPLKRHDSDIDDIDFDDVFQDDEEGGVEHEVEDEDAREGKERIRKETKGYIPGRHGDSDSMDFEENQKLTSEGKQLKKLVRTLDEDLVDDSDEDGDPYASSEDEVESDADKDETKSETEGTQKKAAAPPKKKGPVPTPKPPVPKKGQTAKIKKEGLSRPIGRPGSPSLHNNISRKESISPPPMSRPHSPTSPGVPRHRDVSPPSASPQRKRKAEDALGDQHAPPEGHKRTPIASSSASSPATEVRHEEPLITEADVIAALRGKRMSTKEFLMLFKRRIKKNPKNREIVATLLKRVARHISTDDPKTRVLELRPDLQ